MNQTAHIADGRMSVEVDATVGGRIAQIRVDDTPLLVGRDAVDADALSWGAYPMVPWAGRIRHGRFDFRGTTYELPANHGSHAMHGVGFTSPWEVTGQTATRVDLRLDLPTDERWPFGGRVDQTIEVDEGGVTTAMFLHADGQAFPFSMGWHPWFRKPERLDFRPTAMYRRDDEHIALDELVDVPDGPWDDCFLADGPIGLRIDGVEVAIDSPCRHWVVYDEPAHATCVEPQTGPPDAFNIAQEVVEAGGTVTASYRVRAV